jgi:adenylate cyclase
MERALRSPCNNFDRGRQLGPTFRIQVFRKQRLAFAGEVEGPVEMGRQQRPEEPLFVEQPAPAGRRIAIARLDESTISRAHLRLELLAADRFRATNLSSRNVIVVDDGQTLGPAKSGEFQMPALLTIADAGVRVEPAIAAEPEFEMLARPTLLPSRSSSRSVGPTPFHRIDGAAEGLAMRGLLGEPAAAPRTILPLPTQTPESVIVWLQTVIDVLQSAASSTDFFDRAAAAVVELVGLDSGCVLQADGEHWRVTSQCVGPRLPGAANELRPSARILARMKQEKRTFWHAPSTSGPLPNVQSLADVQAVVVAPILDPSGGVIGALYGDRRLGRAAEAAASISKLEAMIVETLACGVAAGLSRLDQEQKALSARVQFEQFFTPELAHQLTVEPDLLKGRDAEVTLLFCDIRGFSRISDRLGPTATVEWIGDVLGALSDCVIGHRGVLVDYMGDELMAMWGAPLLQPEHAQLACRAALEMWQALPELNERWESKIGERFGVGIGINTGVARVGNTGSHRKFKYGPLGSTVNVASRVQGATKYLKSGVIVTAATQSRLGSDFCTRRLCNVRVVNIAEPIELYELRADSDPGWRAICKQYEQALRQFEGQDFQAAAATLGRLVTEHSDDGPALVLLSRTVNLLVDPDVEFDKAWELPGK